jgi:hypothetical protein
MLAVSVKDDTLKRQYSNKMKRAIKAAAFVQGNVYWRVPYVGAQPEREDV